MPNSLNVLTGEATIDPGYVAPSLPKPSIAVIRSATSLSRSEFCNALKSNGILNFQEALAAAKGDWPVTFASALSSMPVGVQEQIQITWAAVQTIDRMNSLILTIQAALAWTDAQVDALFGILP